MYKSLNTRTHRIAASLLAALIAFSISACGTDADPDEKAEAVGPDAGIAAQSEAAGVGWAWDAEEIDGLDQRLIGEGEEAAVLVHREGQEPSSDIAIYLHGWPPDPPRLYQSHLRDLIDRGYAVIYPVYRLEGTPAEEAGDNAIAGIKASLEELDSKPRSLIAIGHVTGAAIAYDYAAQASELGLPAPELVIALRPGRRPDGLIPPADHSKIEADTRILIATATNHRVPRGGALIRKMLRDASSVPEKHRDLFVARPEPGLSTADATADSLSKIWSAAMAWLDRSRAPKAPLRPDAKGP